MTRRNKYGAVNQPPHNPEPHETTVPVIESETVVPRRAFKCPACRIDFAAAQNYQKHMYREHGLLVKVGEVA